MRPPNITWVFGVNSNIGLCDREEHVYAPLDADARELAQSLYEAGYIKVEYIRKEWERWAWPGGYPLYYVCTDGGVLCSKCVNDNIKMTSDPEAERDWRVVGVDINYEDNELFCDHCGERCESAYCEPDDADAPASTGHDTGEDYGPAEDLCGY